MHPDAYAILAGSASAELKVKGSRFLALCWPVRDEAEALVQRERAAEAHADASHLCWALRLGRPERARELNSDDGEPGGSAGAPIARALVSGGVSDALCMVLRWFGGTKLGVGGLVRAYGGVAREALASAPRGERLALRQLEGSFDYAHEGALRALLAAGAGRVIAQSRDARVHWRLALPPSALADFNAKAADLVRGPSPFAPVDEDEASL
jgi:uncharacterized YigZ family protein